ncbi:MAG TPA: trypsin-like peptidase domain-containing protein [Gemmatimonadales bacterium]|nr:trypsin-like peptidase domain-containing protein [Gemmatimonadales bacterium]
MSHHSRNWLKFGSLVALAFVLGLFFAGLLDFPRTSFAQSGQGSAPIIPVSAPRIPAARPLADLSEAFSAVAEAVRPSVVYVESTRPASQAPNQGQPIIPPGLEKLFPDAEPPQEDGVERATGSGFIVSSDGYILTNNHVIEGATEVKVRLLDGRVLPAAVVGSDKTTDVGVLKITADHLTPAALGSSAAVRVGEWVLAIGNPLGDNLTFSVTQGIVSAKGRGLGPLTGSDRDIQDFIQTDAAINRGNSGGPLINVRGQVIGINSAIASFTGYYAGYAFAVPIDLASAVMNQIIAHGQVERTGMGVYVHTATEEDATYLGLDSIAGVRVDDYADDSPAKRAGIKPGDVITAVDGTPVNYVAQLQQLVGFRRAGDAVKVTAVGPSGTRDFTVRLISNGPSEGSTPMPVPTHAPPTSAEQNPLGIGIEALTPSTAAGMKLPASTKGLLVRSVSPSSPALDHLCPIDNPQRCLPEVITSVEGKPVRTEAEFKSLLAEGGRNGVVSLTVLRADGQQISRIERVSLKKAQ